MTRAPVLRQAPDPRLILASRSQARANLLRAAGLSFSVAPAAIDEGEIRRSARSANATAEAAATMLADLKAARVAMAQPDALVIGADQILVCDDSWFDKPASIQDARTQLLALRGRAHILMTSVVCRRGPQRLWQHVARPRLRMRVFSEQFADAYLDTEADHVTQTVGAYRLEGPGIQLFDEIAGDHAAILGLPLLPLLGFLRGLGVIAV